jgi:hypothetical protein
MIIGKFSVGCLVFVMTCVCILRRCPGTRDARTRDLLVPTAAKQIYSSPQLSYDPFLQQTSTLIDNPNTTPSKPIIATRLLIRSARCDIILASYSAISPSSIRFLSCYCGNTEQISYLRLPELASKPSKQVLSNEKGRQSKNLRTIYLARTTKTSNLPLNHRH